MLDQWFRWTYWQARNSGLKSPGLLKCASEINVVMRQRRTKVCGETLLQVTSHGMEMIQDKPTLRIVYLFATGILAIIKQEIAHVVSRSTIRSALRLNRAEYTGAEYLMTWVLWWPDKRQEL